MQNHYILIDECLKELRQCDIPAIPKLRLEVQLFQVKLLLMRDEVRRETKVKFCSETMLREIRHQLACLDHAEASDGSLEAVGLRLQQMGFKLAAACSTASNRSPRL